MEYCESRYSQQSTVATLKRLGYFEVVGECLPYLPLQLRLKGLSFLWGGLPFWTGFVEQMWNALDSLGHRSEVLLPRDSVVSSDSLVNVKLMDELLSGGGTDVVLKSGQSIQRSVLAFLIRELELVLPEVVANGMGECLRQADLVDFPGARSRLPLDVAVLQSSSESTMKIRRCAFVGARRFTSLLYNQELEIGSLLHIWTTGNPSANHPRSIQDWIQEHWRSSQSPPGLLNWTEGNTKAQGVDASGHVNPLFVVDEIQSFDEQMKGIR